MADEPNHAELKPCWRCGDTCVEYFEDGFGRQCMRCDDCGMVVSFDGIESRAEAIAAWNRRAPDKTAAELAKAVKLMLSVVPDRPHEPQDVASVFGISRALACEIAYENDEGGWRETPEERWARMRRWVDRHIAEPKTASA